MSRFSDDYDCDYRNSAELWQANLDRALSGKRGKKALAQLRDALRALPEKRLISGALCTVGGMDRPDAPKPMETKWGPSWVHGEFVGKLEDEGEGVCAVGAFLWHKRVKAGADPRTAFDELPMLLDSEHDAWETAEAGKAAGLTFTLASHLAYKNDEAFDGMTPEERYEAFMVWLDDQLRGVAA